MRYYNGNFISATDQDPSSSSVNGIFNLESHLVHVKAGRWMQTASSPVFQSAATSGDGTKIILTYNQALSTTATAPASAFAVVVNSSAATVSSVAVSGSTVELTLSAAITTGQTVTVAYTDPTGSDDTNAVQNAAGIDAASFTATSVTVSLSTVALTAAEHYYDEGSSPAGYDETRNMNSDSGANELWSDIPVVTTSGKRLFVIIAALRDTNSDATTWAEQFNNSDLNYELELKYNSVTTALTYRGAYAASEFNSTSIWTAFADGATSATDDYSIRFHAIDDNSHGNFAFSGIVVDNVSYVDYVNIEALPYSEADDTVTSALNLAPNNAAGSTHVLRIAASNASNISSNVIDYNKGGSEPTYTQIGEGDNGTNERHHHAYYFGTHGTQVNMTGTFGDGSTVASDGISGLGCIIGLS